jgi:hypothetical protein
MLKVVSKETVHTDMAPGRSYLTKGKIYDVLDQCSSTYNIIDDTGCRANYWKSRFNPLDCGICNDRKCNSCPVDKETKC